MARVVTVCTLRHRIAAAVDMSVIRWFRISAALADYGHRVDIATNEPSLWLGWRSIRMAERLRRVPIRWVRWDKYDVVKTLFHEGFDALSRFGGDRHPFVISKLGSVVAPEDRPGILFHGRMRQLLYETQQRIHQRSRYITVLSPPAAELWTECFGPSDKILQVPGAADRDLNPPGPDPYPAPDRPRCIFAGNIYGRRSQPEANRVLVEKLNRLGDLLRRDGCQLYLLGPGDTTGLDRQAVRYLGAVPYKRSWDYLHHADVGVLLSAGPFMHNNESTKIYHYLRVGLPVVSEAGFPNDHVLRESGLSFIVGAGDLEEMARRIVEASRVDWDRERARRFILEKHTWNTRARVYDDLLREHFRPEQEPVA